MGLKANIDDTRATAGNRIRILRMYDRNRLLNERSLFQSLSKTAFAMHVNYRVGLSVRVPGRSIELMRFEGWARFSC